jgi:hypothetical protein
MKKILYKIGIHYEAFIQHDGDILHLLNRRNGISHGAERKGLDEKTYERLEGVVFQIMDDLIEVIIDALKNEVFRRNASVV